MRRRICGSRRPLQEGHSRGSDGEVVRVESSSRRRRCHRSGTHAIGRPSIGASSRAPATATFDGRPRPSGRAWQYWRRWTPAPAHLNEARAPHSALGPGGTARNYYEGAVAYFPPQSLRKVRDTCRSNSEAFGCCQRCWLEKLRGRAVMASDENRNDGRDRDREVERYRQAAISSLEQLEWVVRYLHQIRKPELARAVERNRKQIIARLP
jgi:hypothetical protein